VKVSGLIAHRTYRTDQKEGFDMNHAKSALLTLVASTALLVASPVMAQTSTPPSTTTTTPDRRDLTCGKILELTSDHATLQKSNGVAVRVKLAGTTRYVAHSYVAAVSGLHVGDFAAVVGGDGLGDGAAHVLHFALQDLCIARKNRLTLKGSIASFTGNRLTVTAAGHDPFIFALNSATKFYLNGHQVQVPNFRVGEALRVVAHQENDGSYTALVVALRTQA
jgi:hypothetical protein